MIVPFRIEGEGDHLRCIPALEKIPRLVCMVESVSGRVVWALLFAVLLTFPGRLDPFLTLGILFLAVSSLTRPVKLVLFFFWLPLTGFFLRIPNSWGLLPRAEAVRELNLVVTEFIHLPEFTAQLACRGALALLLLAFIAAGRFFRFSLSFGALFIVWLGLVLCALFIPENSGSYPFAWTLMFYFGQSLFALSYFSLFSAGQAGKRILTGLAMATQALSTGSNFPMIRNPDELSATSRAELAVCQIKAMKLLIWSKVIDTARAVIVSLFFAENSLSQLYFSWIPTLSWPNYTSTGIDTYLSMGLPLGQIWATVLVNALCFTLLLSSFTGYSIAVLRLSGIYVPRAVFRPYLAQTFNGYFRRLLYFYSEILIYFFFFPAWRALRSLVSDKFYRRMLSLFFAVFAGGLVFHALENSDYVLYFGARDTAGFLVSQIPYFLAVAVVSCASASGIFTKVMPLPRFIRIVPIFFVHALLLTLVGSHPRDTWHSHWLFLTALF